MATVNNPAMTVGVQISLPDAIFIFSDTYLEAGLLDHVVILFLIFKKLFMAVLHLSLVAAHGAALYCCGQASHGCSFPCCRAQALRVWASVVVAHGPSCPVVCGIFCARD